MDDKPKSDEIKLTATQMGRMVGEVTAKLEAARRPTPVQRASVAIVAAVPSVINALLGTISQVIFGLVLMAGGWFIAQKALATSPPNSMLLYVGIGVAVFGGLSMPSVFAMVKPILVFVFPGGLPFIGGKRAGDPPKPPEGQ